MAMEMNAEYSIDWNRMVNVSDECGLLGWLVLFEF